MKDNGQYFNESQNKIQNLIKTNEKLNNLVAKLKNRGTMGEEQFCTSNNTSVEREG